MSERCQVGSESELREVEWIERDRKKTRIREAIAEFIILFNRKWMRVE